MRLRLARHFILALFFTTFAFPVFAEVQKANAPLKKVENVDLAKAILKPKPYQVALPRDPFKPLYGKSSLLPLEEQETETMPDFKVVGIMSKEGAPLAILETPPKGNTVLLREGTKIEKYTVKKIEPKKVILEKGDKTFILQIKEGK
ncbi:MAG: hypothetical protein PHO42_02705 [Candidatus Omnitrophica bacterium]|nr:hypothetical protein [Candidatus Omnitrophota bacterium]